MGADVTLQSETQTAKLIATPAIDEALALSWRHQASFVALSFKNFALRLATLGIYGFWGKTEVRRRIWSSIRLNGEPLQYTGTGGEMFLGFLVIFGVVLLPITLLSFGAAIVFGTRPGVLGLVQVVIYAATFFLVGIGIHRGQRYRLSRTRWRGIRGALEGSSLQYAWLHFWTGLLLIPTLGWIAPWRSTRLQHVITNGMRFGDRPFQFHARSGPLYRHFAPLWIGGALVGVVLAALYFGGVLAVTQLVVAGADGRPSQSALVMIGLLVYGFAIVGYLFFSLLSAWYRARLMNHFAANTTYEGARFMGHATARSLIWLTITNTLLTVFSLGLLSPVAQARSARYFIERLSIEGTAPLGQIAQRSADELQRGEGLAQAFDVDAF